MRVLAVEQRPQGRCFPFLYTLTLPSVPPSLRPPALRLPVSRSPALPSSLIQQRASTARTLTLLYIEGP